MYHTYMYMVYYTEELLPFIYAFFVMSLCHEPDHAEARVSLHALYTDQTLQIDVFVIRPSTSHPC